MSDARETDVAPGGTLYGVLLSGLIEWAGESADLDDCRDAARHLTPVVRAHVARYLPEQRP